MELAAQGALAPSAPALLADPAAARDAVFGPALEKPEQAMRRFWGRHPEA